VKNDAGYDYDSAGSIQLYQIPNETYCGANSQEVFNIDHSANTAPQKLAASYILPI
jgi:hypothetical protein